jgi:tetratricopeptide (TPR) repeat protein
MKPENLFDRILNPQDGVVEKWHFTVVVLLVLLVVMTYSGATKNNFVDWDDNDYVINNELVRKNWNPNLKEIFSTVVSLNYHPLTILSLSLNDNSCKDCPNGISAKPFIINNIILHILNTILVFFLIYILFGKKLVLAFIVAAIFGVHPMHVESVAWISGRKDVLNSFFLLSGLISYLMYIKEARYKYFWLLLSFVLFILACLSKATAVVFPVIIILINYLILDDGKDNYEDKILLRIFSPRIILPLLPFFAVSIFFGLMAVSLQNGENFLGMLKFTKDPEDVVNIVGHFSGLQRIQIASYGFFIYVIKFFSPVNQSAFYPYPPLAEINHENFSVLIWISFLAFIVTVFLVIFSMKKARLFMFSFGFYLVTLALVLQFVSVGKAIIAERYTYLPYIGLSIIPAWFISQSPLKTRRWLLFISGAFIIIMILLARNQVKVWHDSESLWTQVIERHPNLELARRARGKYYYMLSSHALNQKEKKILEEKALVDFRVAIKEKTGSADVYEGMGVILQSRNELKTALQLLNVAVKLNPEKGRTYYNRAIIFDQLNQKEEAIRDYQSAITFSPEMALEILRNRSVLYIEAGRFESAIKDLDELIRIEEKDFTHYYNRAFSKLMLKDIDGAIIDYKNVLRLNPSDKETMEHLRVLMESQKNK